jgi:hypothetical protein
MQSMQLGISTKEMQKTYLANNQKWSWIDLSGLNCYVDDGDDDDDDD